MNLDIVHKNLLKTFLIERGFKSLGRFIRFQEEFLNPNSEEKLSMEIVQLVLKTPDGDSSLTIEHCKLGDWEHCSLVPVGDFSGVPFIPCKTRFEAWLEPRNSVPNCPTFTPINFEEYYEMVLTEIYVAAMRKLGIDVVVHTSHQPPSFPIIFYDMDCDD